MLWRPQWNVQGMNGNTRLNLHGSFSISHARSDSFRTPYSGAPYPWGLSSQEFNIYFIFDIVQYFKNYKYIWKSHLSVFLIIKYYVRLKSWIKYINIRNSTILFNYEIKTFLKIYSSHVRIIYVYDTKKQNNLNRSIK